MSGDVLVVGGYGAVGRRVCRLLAGSVTGTVLAGGRTLASAQRFAAGVDGCRPRRVDVADPGSFDDALAGVDTVVTCVDQADATFPRACLARGVDYLDCSPSDRLLRAVATADDVARESGARGVLSVGLAPGATNLLATDALADLDAPNRVDVTLLLGLGDDFGPDTLRWTAADAGGWFTVREDDRAVRVRGYADPRTVSLPGWGRRTCYRIDLADQHALARTTDVPTVATRFCYDSPAATRAVAVLHRAGLVGPLVDGVGPERLAALARRLPGGTDETVAMVSVTGTRNGRECRLKRWVRGPDQALATAVVAATAVRRLRGGGDENGPPGVAHLHERVDPAPFLDALSDAGYEVGRATVRPGSWG